VQARVAENRVKREMGSDATSPSLLAGLVFDEAGDHLTPTHANKKGTRYRYYVSHRLVSNGRGDKTQGGVRIAATVLEDIVTSRLIAFLGDRSQIHDVLSASRTGAGDRVRLIAAARALSENWPSLPMAKRREWLRILVSKATVGRHSVDLTMRTGGVIATLADGEPDPDQASRDDTNTITLSVPTRLKRAGRETKLVIDGPGGPQAIPNPTLVKLIAKGQRFRDLLMEGNAASIQGLADTEGVSRPYFSSVDRLGFLAPDVINAIVRGEQPASLTAKWLLKNTALPSDWSDQHAVLGFD
jgi:site-specific DNA recombinase